MADVDHVVNAQSDEHNEADGLAQTELPAHEEHGGNQGEKHVADAEEGEEGGWDRPGGEQQDEG